MYGKRVIPKSERVDGQHIKPKYTASEKHLKKIKKSVMYSSYRKIYDVLKGHRKRSDILKYLGCSIEEFKAHIESQFKHGMTWDNWSKSGWHLDHIIPLEKLDPSNDEDFKTACHYTNFQPMWASNNCAKRSELPTVFLLTGCFGSDKAWVSNQLSNDYHIYDYGSKKYTDSDFTNPPDFSKPILYILPDKVSTFLKSMKDKLNIKLIIIIEPESATKDRVKRLYCLSKKCDFSGSSQDVLKYLKRS
jgi:hypothetical protein